MQARIFVLGGRSAGRSFLVRAGAVVGRDEACAVRLADRSISRRHARLAHEGGAWRIEDLGSRNGTWVGDARVEVHTLGDREELVLGNVRVRFLSADEDPGAPEALAAADAPAPDVEPEEIHLEEDPEPLGATRTVLRPQPIGGAPSAPVRSPVRTVEGQESAVAVPTDRERARVAARARILGTHRRAGLLAGDLGQQPPWLRALLGVVLLLGAAGVALLAFWAARALRG